MPTLDKRIDTYIKKAPEFARPILTALRDAIHAGCPDVVETLKWSAPAFEHHGILCGMAAFKQHCTFGFWKHALVVGEKRNDEAWGTFGRITSGKDLPAKSTMVRLVKKAAKLNEEGVKVEKPKRAPKPPIPMHPAFQRALLANSKAHTQFPAFSPSKQREYLEWIAEAKTDATRDRRIKDAVAWIAEGKPRNWKYMNC